MRILVTGVSGFLGSVCAELLIERPATSITALRSATRPWRLSRRIAEVVTPDDLSPQALKVLLNPIAPTHILHCGALSSVELCERDPALASRWNWRFTDMLARFASDSGAHLTTVSTDLVFDGTKAPKGGLTEEAPAAPLSEYARSKYAAEQTTLSLSRSAVVRVSLLYGHSSSPSAGVLGWMERSLKERARLPLFEDEFRTPIHVRDASTALLEVVTKEARGIWHCGGPERLSRVEFGIEVATSLGHDASLITKASRLGHTVAPARPEDVSLSSKKLSLFLGREALSVREALTKYARL